MQKLDINTVVLGTSKGHLRRGVFAVKLLSCCCILTCYTLTLAKKAGLV